MDMKVRIKEKSWVAGIAAAKMKADKVAIVFGNTIHLHHTTPEEFLQDKQWVCHELKHVEQYRRHGFAGFLVQYLAEWIKKGYYNNKFEVEARENELNESLIEQVEFI
jgi:GNAT superfamily N-acetyltransferase